MARAILVLFSLFIVCCVAQFGVQSVKQDICLYAGFPITNTLKPLQLKNTDCPKNTSQCMCAVYNYAPSLFRYNGIPALMPKLGEVVAFLTQDQQGVVNLVVMLNANKDVNSLVKVIISGAEPTDILLKDDPQNDDWLWNPQNNSGIFTWRTKPSYTDGVVIGPINFIDNYCVTASFTQAQDAIKNVSVLSGTTSNVQRVLSQPYVAGASFQFCQYPRTVTYKKDATCPGRSDGSASIDIVFGPTNVQYKWFSEATGQQIYTGQNLTNVPAGTYLAVVNDTSTAGCSANRQVVIGDNGITGTSVATTSFACSTKGTASVSVAGGAGGFSYAWFTKAGTPVGSNSNSISGLNNGDYYVRVTDSCGSVVQNNFTIPTVGCCGDGICNATSETCTSGTPCEADCGKCCQAGTYVNNGNCVVCPPGSYSSTIQSSQCTNCPANTYNAGGSDACAGCPANTYSAAGSGKCTSCAAGSVRASGEASCHACSAGTFAACGSSPCTACAAGSTSADGAYTCTPCSPGTATSDGVSCSQCAKGTYAAAGSAECTTCPTGTTTPSAGATHMLACN